MTATPVPPAPGHRFAGRVIAVSVSEAEDLAVLGLPQDTMDQALQALLVPLVSEGARIAYGGRIEHSHNFTLVISEQLGEAYRQLEQRPGSRPFVHVVAQQRWLTTPAAVRTDHLQRLAPYGEVWVTGTEGVRATFAAASRERPDLAACVGCGLGGPGPLEWASGVSGLVRTAAQVAVEVDPPESADQSFTQMREHMAAFCDARLLVGGRKTGFAGRIAGVCEEALETVQAGRPLLVMGGFGGAARDVAEALGLVDAGFCVPRKPGQDPEGRYEAGLQALRELRPRFESGFTPSQLALARQVARSESLAEAAIGATALLADRLGAA